MQDLEIRELSPEINPEFAFKVVFLGDSGVGKTSLIKYEIKNSFISENDSTIIFEHSFKNFSIMGKNVRLQIWDTCGKEMYRSSVQNFYRSALCIFVVFSLESLDSFNQVNQWIEEIKENNIEDYILVLIGNKSDLTPPRKVEREVIEFLKLLLSSYLLNSHYPLSMKIRKIEMKKKNYLSIKNFIIKILWDVTKVVAIINRNIIINKLKYLK